MTLSGGTRDRRSTAYVKDSALVAGMTRMKVISFTRFLSHELNCPYNHHNRECFAEMFELLLYPHAERAVRENQYF